MTRQGQIRLNWKSHQGSLVSSFDRLLSKEALVDVTLACEGKYVNAHKIVLSACSPYLEELLTIDPNKHPIIFLKDTSYVVLKALIEYMYRGEVSIPQSSLQNLILLAQALKIRGLTELESLTNVCHVIRNGENSENGESSFFHSPNVAASVSSSTCKAVPRHHQYRKGKSNHPPRADLTNFSSRLLPISPFSSEIHTNTETSQYATTVNIEGCEVSQFEIDSEGNDLSNTIYEYEEFDESNEPMVVTDHREFRVMNFPEEADDTMVDSSLSAIWELEDKVKGDPVDAQSLSYTARIKVESKPLSHKRSRIRRIARSGEGDLLSHRKGRRTKICSFQCPNSGCGRYYSQKSSLKRHMDFECYKEPKFVCSFCGLRSKLRGNAEIHEKRCKFRTAAFT